MTLSGLVAAPTIAMLTFPLWGMSQYICRAHVQPSSIIACCCFSDTFSPPTFHVPRLCPSFLSPSSSIPANLLQHSFVRFASCPPVVISRGWTPRRFNHIEPRRNHGRIVASIPLRSPSFTQLLWSDRPSFQPQGRDRGELDSSRAQTEAQRAVNQLQSTPGFCMWRTLCWTLCNWNALTQ